MNNRCSIGWNLFAIIFVIHLTMCSPVYTSNLLLKYCHNNDVQRVSFDTKGVDWFFVLFMSWMSLTNWKHTSLVSDIQSKEVFFKKFIK